MSIQNQLQQIVTLHLAPLINEPGTAASSGKAPGGIAAIWYDHAEYYFSFGFVDANGSAPTPDTIFGLGSVTKTLTTSILGQRQELFGTRVMQNPVPGLQLKPRESAATFMHLATFSAGIPSVPGTCGTPATGPCTQKEWIDFLNGVVPATSLPTHNVYSDSSIGLIGQSLLHEDGISDFGPRSTTGWYRTNLLTALGMHHTSSPPAPDNTHPLATAYEFAGGQYVAIDYDGWCPWGTAGRMYSTPRDMIRFIQANLGIDTIDHQAVPQNILAGMRFALAPWGLMSKPASANRQGFAWIVWPVDPVTGSQIRGKAGGVPGVSSFLAVNPEMQYGMILLTNMRGVATEGPLIAAMQAIRAL